MKDGFIRKNLILYPYGFVILFCLVFIVGCSRDLSKKINVDSANNIAFKEVYGDKNISVRSVIRSNSELTNGDFDVTLVDLNNTKCAYFVSITYDGARILGEKHICN